MHVWQRVRGALCHSADHLSIGPVFPREHPCYLLCTPNWDCGSSSAPFRSSNKRRGRRCLSSLQAPSARCLKRKTCSAHTAQRWSPLAPLQRCAGQDTVHCSVACASHRPSHLAPLIACRRRQPPPPHRHHCRRRRRRLPSAARLPPSRSQPSMLARSRLARRWQASRMILQILLLHTRCGNALGSAHFRMLMRGGRARRE